MEFISVIDRIQVNVFLFDSTPETLYPNIVFTSASAVHTDTNMMLLQTLYPTFTGILTALVGIYYFRCTLFRDTLFKKSDTITCRQIIAQSPPHYEPAIHIDNGIQVHKPTSHRYVGYIRTPNLVRVLRLNVPEQVGIHILCPTAFRKAFLRVNAFHAHDFHQPANTLMVYSKSLKVEEIHKLLYTRCRMLQQDFIHLLHQIQICLRFHFRIIIEAASAYMHLPAKTVDAHSVRKLLPKFHYLTFSPASSQALAKKSFSMVSSPTFFRSCAFSAFRCLTNLSCELSGLTKAALAFCKNSAFQAAIFEGETLNSFANSFNVFCSLTASKATLALKEASNLLLRPMKFPFFLRYKSIKIVFNLCTCLNFGVYYNNQHQIICLFEI